MGIVVGKGVKAEKVEKDLAKVELLPGEVIWWVGKCNNFRPMMDRLAVSNCRLLGLSRVEGLKWAALWDELSSIGYDQKKGIVSVVSAVAGPVAFKQIASADVPAVEHYVSFASQAGVPSGLREVIEAAAAERADHAAQLVAAAQAEKTARLEQRAAAKADRTAAKAASKAEKERLRAERAAIELQNYGRCIGGELFGGRMVSFYDKGFVQVHFPFLGKNAPFEKLLGVQASSDVGKKSGAGRAVGFVASGGLNMLASNKRGDVWLTIRTDRQVYTLHEEPPTAMNLKQVRRLEGIGISIINATASGEDAPEIPAAPTDLPAVVTNNAGEQSSITDNMTELTKLRDAGLINGDEYAQMRARLLDALLE